VELASRVTVVNIARCPVHGLHGCRDVCFAFEHEGERDCDGRVEQVPMVPATAHERLRAALEYLADPESWGGDPHECRATLYGHDTPLEVAARALAEAEAASL
jgi:hypothetical protein